MVQKYHFFCKYAFIMKEKLQTKFATRQYMISDTFELYYYSTVDVPGVKEHTHTHYEFYLFLEGAISLEIDGVLYTPTPGDLLLIPPGVPHHLVMHDLSVPYRRFVFWVSATFAEQLRARSADYVYLMEYAAENQKYLFPLDSVEFNTIQYRTIRLIEEMRSDHFGKETQIFLYVSDLLMQINRTVYEQHHPLTRKAQLSLYEQLCFYINEHLSEDLSLERLAAELFVSKYHIAHVFKDEIGMSIHQYISKKRLARCREALLGDVPVTIRSFQMHCLLCTFQEVFNMFQMWGKLVENNHILQDLTVCIDDEDTRTHKVFRALDEICDAWNLAKPIWLDTNILEFKRRSKTRFTQDNFIESLEFDYLEIQITEE